jgi:hypothetical protein
VSLEETLVLLKVSNNQHTSFSAMAHLAQGLCLNAPITLSVDDDDDEKYHYNCNQSLEDGRKVSS